MHNRELKWCIFQGATVVVGKGATRRWMQKVGTCVLRVGVDKPPDLSLGRTVAGNDQRTEEGLYQLQSPCMWLFLVTSYPCTQAASWGEGEEV